MGVVIIKLYNECTPSPDCTVAIADLVEGIFMINSHLYNKNNCKLI